MLCARAASCMRFRFGTAATQRGRAVQPAFMISRKRSAVVCGSTVTSLSSGAGGALACAQSETTSAVDGVATATASAAAKVAVVNLSDRFILSSSLGTGIILRPGRDYTSGRSLRTSGLPLLFGAEARETVPFCALRERVDAPRKPLAGFDEILFPPVARKGPRRGELDCPFLDLTVVIDDIEENPAMRIGPVETLDRPLEHDRFLEVEQGKGMIRLGGNRCRDQEDVREPEHCASLT